MKIIIFTDGSSRGNPGPGGWASVIVKDDHVTELGARESMTTNNRMELSAAIGALAHHSLQDQNDEITIFTDSSYVIKGITTWVKIWKRNGWLTKTKQDVSNKDLWMKLDEVASGKKIEWKYVGGHVGVVGNERCDEIATSFADAVHMDLYDGPLSQYKIANIKDVSHDPELKADKKSSGSRAKTKAFSYVSAIGGVVKVHSSWTECEKRVKGAKGARFKKALNKEEEEKIKKDFS